MIKTFWRIFPRPIKQYLQKIIQLNTITLYLDVKTLNALPLISGTRQGCLPSPLQLNSVVDVKANTVR